MIEDRKNNLENNKKVVFQNRLSDWREIRDKKLKELDIKFLIALENLIKTMPNNEEVENLKSIIDKKQSLRDITKWNNFDDIKDEIEMMDFLPDVLK